MFWFILPRKTKAWSTVRNSTICFRTRFFVFSTFFLSFLGVSFQFLFSLQPFLLLPALLYVLILQLSFHVLFCHSPLFLFFLCHSQMIQLVHHPQMETFLFQKSIPSVLILKSQSRPDPHQTFFWENQYGKTSILLMDCFWLMKWSYQFYNRQI